MSEKPLVSVAIPCFNHERYVRECIKSVIDQDYDNIELIIIDDGSSDKSVEAINEMVAACRERFVRFEFRHRENKGLSATQNEAIEWARGMYFSVIASDDVMYPEKTSILLEHIEKEKAMAGIFCGCYILDSNSRITDAVRPSETLCSFEDILLRNKKCKIVTATQLLRLDCLTSVGGYPVNLFVNDWYMWLVLAQKGYQLKVIDSLLVGYRQHEKNSSSDALKMYEERKKVLSYFEANPFHEKALALVALIASIDFTSISKRKSVGFLLDSIGYSKTVVLTPLFLNCLLRIVIPRIVILQLKKARHILANPTKTLERWSQEIGQPDK